MSDRGKLTLYSRIGCPLCDEAKEVLAGLGAAWEEIDVDADPVLRDRYGERVPVIEVDGRVLAEGNLEGVRLAELLRSR